jgi:hypothetical protein
MTVCGFAKTNSGTGFAWADSEGYIDRRPIAEHKRKLFVTAGALVGMGVGYRTLTDAFQSILTGLGHASFSTVLRRLPALLRHALVVDDAERRAPRKTHTTLAVCGMERGEFHGGVFGEANNFEPVSREAWVSPHVDQHVDSAGDVLQIAQRQIQIVRREISAAATGGALSVAKVGPDRVVQLRVPLLIGAERGRAA